MLESLPAESVVLVEGVVSDRPGNNSNEVTEGNIFWRIARNVTFPKPNSLWQIICNECLLW